MDSLWGLSEGPGVSAESSSTRRQGTPERRRSSLSFLAPEDADGSARPLVPARSEPSLSALSCVANPPPRDEAPASPLPQWWTSLESAALAAASPAPGLSAGSPESSPGLPLARRHSSPHAPASSHSSTKTHFCLADTEEKELLRSPPAASPTTPTSPLSRSSFPSSLSFSPSSLSPSSRPSSPSLSSAPAASVDLEPDTFSARPRAAFFCSPLVYASPRGGDSRGLEPPPSEGGRAGGPTTPVQGRPEGAAPAILLPHLGKAASGVSAQANSQALSSSRGDSRSSGPVSGTLSPLTLPAPPLSPLSPVSAGASVSYLHSPLISLPPPAGAAATTALALGAFPVIAQVTDGVVLFPAYSPPPWVQAFELARWRFGDADDRQAWTVKQMRFVLDNRLFPLPTDAAVTPSETKTQDTLSLPASLDAATTAASQRDLLISATPDGVKEDLTARAPGDPAPGDTLAGDTLAGGASSPSGLRRRPAPVVVVEFGSAQSPSAASLETAVATLEAYFRGDKPGPGPVGGERERRHSFSFSPRVGATHAGGGGSAGSLFSLGYGGNPLVRRRSSSNLDAGELRGEKKGEASVVGSSALPAFSCSSPEVVYSALKSAIRFGVPDGLKKTIWLVANNAWEFLKGHPQLYKNALQQTFGDKVPATLKGKCPTFSAGVLGLQEDISGKQTRLKDFEFETDTPLAAWRASGCGDEALSRGEFFADLTESTADLLRNWFALTPRHGPADGHHGPQAAPGATPRWLALLKGRRQKLGSNPLGQAIRNDLNFWPAPPSPLGEPGLRGRSGSPGGDRGFARGEKAGDKARGAVALLHGLGSFRSGELYGETSPSSSDTGPGRFDRDLRKIDEDRDSVPGSTSARGPAAEHLEAPEKKEGGQERREHEGGGRGGPTSDDSPGFAGQESPAWHGRMEADVEALQQARRGEGTTGRGKLFLDYIKHRPETTGEESADMERQATLAKELFGRRDSTEVQDFRRYMRETHHRHMRHAERMRRARERSRERLTTSVAFCTLSQYQAAADSSPWAPRRFNTGSSLDSLSSLAAPSPAGTPWALERNASQESVLPHLRSPAYSDYHLFRAQASLKKLGAGDNKRRGRLRLPWMAAAWPDAPNKPQEGEARTLEAGTLESGLFSAAQTSEPERKSFFGWKKKDTRDAGRAGKEPFASDLRGDRNPLYRASSSPLGFNPPVHAKTGVEGSGGVGTGPATPSSSRLPWRRSGTVSGEGHLGGKQAGPAWLLSKGKSLEGGWLLKSNSSQTEVRQPLGSAPVSQEEGKDADAPAMVAKDKGFLPAPVGDQGPHAPGSASSGSFSGAVKGSGASGGTPRSGQEVGPVASLSPQGRESWGEGSGDRGDRDRPGGRGRDATTERQSSVFASLAFLEGRGADDTAKKKKNFGFFRRLFHQNPFGHGSRRTTTDEGPHEGDREPEGGFGARAQTPGPRDPSLQETEAWPPRLSESREEGESAETGARTKPGGASRPHNGILASCACCCAANVDARPVGPHGASETREGPSDMLSRGFIRAFSQKGGDRGASWGREKREAEERPEDAAVFQLPPSVCFAADSASQLSASQLSASQLSASQLSASQLSASQRSAHWLGVCPSTTVSSSALLVRRGPRQEQGEAWASSPASPTSFGGPTEDAGLAGPGRGDLAKSKEKPEKRHRLLVGLRRHKKAGAKAETRASALAGTGDSSLSMEHSSTPGEGSSGGAASDKARQPVPLHVFPASPVFSAAGCLVHPPSPAGQPARLPGLAASASPLWQALHHVPAASGEQDMEYRRRLKKADVYEVEDVTDFHVLLTESGKEKARRLLWCLNALHGTVEFCPVLPPLTCVLLLYFDEDVAYLILHCLLKKAVQRERSHEPPLVPMKRKDFVRFVKIVTATIAQRLPRLYSHLRSLTIDLAAWVARGVQDGFARMLPFDFVLRIYGAFLFEGANVFYRYCVALLKLLEPSLLNCADHESAEDVLYNCGDDPAVTLSGLTKAAFRYKLRIDEPLHKHTAEFPTPYLMTTRMRQFHRPRLRHESRILQPQHWEAIWGWVPETDRMLVPTLEYSSDTHGMSITAMVQRLSPFLRSPMLLVISTRDHGILGFFSPFAFRYDAKAAAHDAPLDVSFVYQLQPQEQAYWWTGANQLFMSVTHKHIIIGGNDIAIYIDEDLRKGQSKQCASFGSAKLVADEMGDFLISLIEVWILQTE
ncbi:TLD protein [Toxoplasma gondii RUB]|uniref:TLD protein n=1 Tax=Toxoplasma gondii RUB TaxID=935652 RepID=A0A086M0C8_TOXGO|nr:TLD protein [Toxoplasma gondii RUB]